MLLHCPLGRMLRGFITASGAVAPLAIVAQLLMGTGGVSHDQKDLM